MSDIINILPDAIANQIAAGEVIQRPASVVKELVENAIDAGANRISVVITNAGRTSIQVVDNGKGMSHTDARMAFERHATSKITDASDIFRLRTMGFRGEALASIAAVASVELRTRQTGADFGTLVEIAASSILRHEADSCVEGTSFLVKNLFYNVPARRKFLKSDNTELQHIINEFHRVALANPHIELSLYSNNEPIYELQAGNFKQRITAIFGKKTRNYANQLIAISIDTNLVKISGFVGTPQSATRSATQFFFANGRYMRHPYFNKAVQAAYANMLQPDTQPIYFINLEVRPESIDVNVHPTKTEIKFEDEKEIFSILMASVKESLGKFNFTPSLDFETSDTVAMPLYTADQKPDIFKISLNSCYNPFASSSGGGGYKSSLPKNWDMLYEKHQHHSPQQTQAIQTDCVTQQTEQLPIFGNSDEMQNKFLIYREKYLVTAVKSGLMIIDRQRAMERITYEKIILQLQQGQKATQSLLFPDVAEITADEAVVFDEILPDIEAIGFDLEKTSHNTFNIKGVPSILTDIGNIEELLKEIIADVSDQASMVGKEIYEKIALRTAKAIAKSAFRHSSEQETEALIASLFQCEIPNFAPDGKKILVILSDADIWG